MKTPPAKLCFVMALLFQLLAGQIRLSRIIEPDTTLEDKSLTAIAVSSFGDIYLIESRQHQLFRMNAAGKIIRTSGGYGWDSGQLDIPMDIFVASGLDVLVADYNNGRVQRFDRELNYLSHYPSGDEITGILYPRSVTANRFGDLFILDDETTAIRRIDLNGEVSSIGGYGYGDLALRNPIQIRWNTGMRLYALEADGTLYLFDRFGLAMRKIAPPTPIRAEGMLLLPEGVVVFCQGAPAVLFTVSEEGRWKQLLAIDFAPDWALVSAAYTDGNLYFLTDTAQILVCKLEDEPIAP